METKTVCITLWGDALIKGKWLDWYKYVETIFEKLEYKKTHIGIQKRVI